MVCYSLNVLLISAFYADDEYVVASYLVRYKYLSERDVMDDNVLKLHHKYVSICIFLLLFRQREL